MPKYLPKNFSFDAAEINKKEPKFPFRNSRYIDNRIPAVRKKVQKCAKHGRRRRRLRKQRKTWFSMARKQKNIWSGLRENMRRV